MDGLSATYFVAFVAGAGFSIVSWLLGALGSHGDSGHDHGAHGSGEADSISDASEEAGGGHLHLDVHLAGHALEAGGHGAGHGAAAVHGHAPALGHALGHAHGALEHGHGHQHAAPQHGHGHDHGHQGVAAKVMTPLLNLSSLAALSCVGGGVGFIARRAGAGVPLSLLVAVPSGLAAAYLIGGLIAWLRRESHFKEATEIGGQLATILAPGTEVVILDVKDGIARVGAATELLGIEAAPAAEARRQLPQGEKEGAK